LGFQPFHCRIYSCWTVVHFSLSSSNSCTCWQDVNTLNRLTHLLTCYHLSNFHSTTVPNLMFSTWCPQFYGTNWLDFLRFIVDSTLRFIDDSTLVQISTFSFLSQVVHRLYFGCLLVGYAWTWHFILCQSLAVMEVYQGTFSQRFEW